MVDNTKVDVLAEQLRQRIRAGEFGTNGRIPPHRVLAEQLHTTRETVNKVVQLLQSEGLLVARDKSVYVKPPLMKLPAFVANYDLYIRERGLEPVSEFLEKPALVPLPDWVAKLLGRREGEMVPHRLLRQGILYPAGPVYYRLSENFYHPELVKDEVFQELQADPQYNTWTAMKAKYGLEVVKSRNTAVARLPTLREQTHLGIVRGTPVLELHRTQLTQDELSVMVNNLVFVGSLLELSFTSEVTR
ncbi:MAG: GntR family transcriptional regulator [Ktedonobacteraceae bacterium]|nr:GntR family transcriptional regulator [Ktedonobacteraceae bacterium]